MKYVDVTPDALTRLLEEQQKAAVLKWVADPFGNYVKTFPLTLPKGSRVNDRGMIKEWADEPYKLCLSIHEVKVPKASATRAARLPDGGTVHANGTWVWGPGNQPQTQTQTPVSPPAAQ